MKDLKKNMSFDFNFRLMVYIPPKSFVQRFSSCLNDLLTLFGEVACSFDKLCPQQNEIQGMQEVSIFTMMSFSCKQNVKLMYMIDFF